MKKLAIAFVVASLLTFAPLAVTEAGGSKLTASACAGFADGYPALYTSYAWRGLSVVGLGIEYYDLNGVLFAGSVGGFPDPVHHYAAVDIANAGFPQPFDPSTLGGVAIRVTTAKGETFVAQVAAPWSPC